MVDETMTDRSEHEALTSDVGANADADAANNEAAAGSSSEAKSGRAKGDTFPANKSDTGTLDVDDVNRKEEDGDYKGVDEGVSDEPVAAASGDTNHGQTTPASGGKKRKSTGGVPEHKSKKLNKKKSMKELHLDIQPGEQWWGNLRGYPPWPVIICDEEMLPESLLSSRPVSARRPDGTYREDFDKGGKNAKDRTYPVMYLGSNEFQWMKNIDLTPMDMEKVKNADQGKKHKSLWEAYKLAAAEHGLDYYKDMLTEHEKSIMEAAEKARERQEKVKAKEERRKSKLAKAEADGDAEMEDAEEQGENVEKKKKSPSKKRKQGPEDTDNQKPAKQPKTTIKFKTGKEVNGDPASPPKRSKKKKSVAKLEYEDEENIPTEKPETQAERLARREKSVLYLRHKLQKGFLARDNAPKEEEMGQMDSYLQQLETFSELEVQVIRGTKINKVLRGILKLDSIPKDSEFEFKRRSKTLLDGWNKALEGAPPIPAFIESSAAKDGTEKEVATTNGLKSDAKKSEEVNDAGKEAKLAEKSDDAPTEAHDKTQNDSPAAVDEAHEEDEMMPDAKSGEAYNEKPTEDAPDAPAKEAVAS